MLSRLRDALLAGVLLYGMFAVIYGDIGAQNAVGKAGLLFVAVVVIGLAALRRAAIIACTSRTAAGLQVFDGILRAVAV